MHYHLLYLGQIVMSFAWLGLARKAEREYQRIGLAVKLVRASDGATL